MKKASSSATYLALFRATETASKSSFRLFEDPYAIGLLPAILRPVALASHARATALALNWLLDRGWHPRSSAVIRTRMIDDFIEQSSYDAGIQFVILGAGFDSRAYRMQELSASPIFEVDRQATQDVKRRRLEKSLHYIPPNVKFIVADLEKDDLEAALISKGFDTQKSSVILAEGLISHLSRDAVDVMFRQLSRITSTGSQLIFTYIHSDEVENSKVFHEHRWRWWARLNGEPFKFGFRPEHLERYLDYHGFHLISDQSTAVAAAYYMPKTAIRPEQGCAFYRVALATKGHMANAGGCLKKIIAVLPMMCFAGGEKIVIPVYIFINHLTARWRGALYDNYVSNANF